MKKLLLPLLLLASSAALAQSSTIPSLGKLMAWANNMSYANFDREARRLGFSFDEKEEKSDRANYSYLREVTQGNTTYTEQVTYKVFKSDKSTAIEFATTRVDLITFYSL
jgi:hypothetical protein